MTEVPVLFLVFNRPDVTLRVFNAIREAQPSRLYIGADGPREEKAGETKLCEEVRNIVTQVDWPCEVKTLFRENNLGCKAAVSGAIDWFFQNEEEGIILEDDCLPSQSFFRYCQELLDRYRDDERIMLINGYNRQGTWKPESGDYFYSYFGGCWGWASWRRAWEKCELDMSDLQEFERRGFFESLLGEKLGKIRKKELLNAPPTSWAYPWAFSRHKNSGLACVPTKTLIENIGFDSDATHTVSSDRKSFSTYEISFPLRVNRFMIPDQEYDLIFVGYLKPWEKVLKKLKRIFS